MPAVPEQVNLAIQIKLPGFGNRADDRERLRNASTARGR